MREPTHGAHPRSRGENFGSRGIVVDTLGSSPLTRGKPVLATSNKRDIGLIPAHAGKTTTGTYMRSSIRAHPRSRGENAYFDWIATINEGSSPLTRGKRRRRRRQRGCGGLIPAHAGKTGARSSLSG